MEIKSREKVDMKDCRSMREVALKLGKEWLGGLCIMQAIARVNRVFKDKPGGLIVYFFNQR